MTEMNNDGRPGGLSSCGPNPSVSAVPASIPDAFEILIDDQTYRARREDEIQSALHSYCLHGSWTAYAAGLLDAMARGQRDPAEQWGSLHHQIAILSAGLAEEAQAIEARRAATTGAVHESAVRKDAPIPPIEGTSHAD